MSRQNRKVDVLVVGAGPAGASAAYRAAMRVGHVLMIDRRVLPGCPVQCAEWVPGSLMSLSSARDAKVQDIHSMRTYLPSGAHKESGFTGMMLNREKFDAGLQEMACRRGTEMWHGSCFVGLDRNENIAYVRREGQVTRIQYKTLIATDGPASRVAYHTGLPALKVLHALQYTVPLPSASSSVSVWLSPDYPGGYAWLFPKGDVANLGVGCESGLPASQSSGFLKKCLDDLYSTLVDNGTIGRNILLQTGGLIPVSGLRDPLVMGNILFAGDAAGCTNPLTGAGIASAVLSGEMAGEAAADYLECQDKGAMEQYRDDLTDLLSPSLKRDARSRMLLGRYWNSGFAYNEEKIKHCWVGFDEYSYRNGVEEASYGMC